MASRAQRAVPDVTDPEAWRRFGRALRDWREDVLGYDTCTGFAADRGINLKLARNLENAYRPGSYIKQSLREAERAYGVTYASMLAFLRGETGTLSRAEAAPVPAQPGSNVEFLPPPLPPSPFLDPARTAADEPYARAIWDRILDLPRRAALTAANVGLDGDDAKAWESNAKRYGLDDLLWLVADLQRQADTGNPGTAAAAPGA